MRAKQSVLLAATGALAVIIGVIVIVSGRSTPAESSIVPASASATYHLDADHPTYTSVATLVQDADVIVAGTVLSSAVDPGVVQTAPDGSPLPPIPHTIYQVRVTTVYHGDPSVGASLPVAIGGGTIDSGSYILDGGPVLATGGSYLFFLKKDGSIFYPLAGGAAIATPDASGTYVLSGEVTGQDVLTVAPSSLPTPVSPTSTAPSISPSGESPTSVSSSSPSISGANSQPLATTGTDAAEHLKIGLGLILLGVLGVLAGSVTGLKRRVRPRRSR